MNAQQNRKRLIELIDGSTKTVRDEVQYFTDVIDENWDDIPDDDVKKCIAFEDAIDSILDDGNSFTNADRSNMKQILLDAGYLEAYDPATMQIMGDKPYWFVHKKVKYNPICSWTEFIGSSFTLPTP